MLILTPKVYGKNMQWKVSPKNIIDTVSSDPIINSVASDNQNIKSYNYTTVKNYGGDVTVNLPAPISLSGSGLLLHELAYARSYRTDMAWGAKHELAKGRVDSIGGRVKATLVLDSPVEGLPQVTVAVTGKSYVCGRGALGYGTYPSWDDLQNPDFDLGKWIYDNKTSNQSYLQANYDGKVPLMPFVSSDGYNSGAVFTYSGARTPVSSDFWCKFNQGYGRGGEQGATNDSWTTGFGQKTRKMVKPLDWTGNNDGLAYLPDASQSLVATLKAGVDKYHYELFVDVPIRVAWACASRYYGALNGEHFLDSFAFLDLITNIEVTMSGRPYNTDDVVYNYSLDASGKLTDTDIKNDNVHKIEHSELITIPTIMNGKPWLEEMSETLLKKYKKGKYIVTAQVPAKWALLNNVHINTKLQIVTLNNEYIARSGSICTFEVKSIIKHFEGATFYYKLQLLEV